MRRHSAVTSTATTHLHVDDEERRLGGVERLEPMHAASPLHHPVDDLLAYLDVVHAGGGAKRQRQTLQHAGDSGRDGRHCRAGYEVRPCKVDARAWRRQAQGNRQDSINTRVYSIQTISARQRLGGPDEGSSARPKSTATAAPT